jgi:ChrR Cupin-like domain
MIRGSEPTDLDALIADLAENDEEAKLMGAAARMLAYAADGPAPSAGLKARLLARIAEPAGRSAQFIAESSFFARAEGIDWVPLAPGIDVKVLFDDPGTRARTLLVRMGPSLHFPEHLHDLIEDLYLVSGEAWVGEVPMAAGDYCRAEAGTEHNHVRSGPAGALAVVVSR